ncbi:MAG: AAA family ATPase [Coxiellaceae bacterium]|nr:AAA family ATPase [Coxiellaceae bacterium]
MSKAIIVMSSSVKAMLQNPDFNAMYRTSFEQRIKDMQNESLRRGANLERIGREKVLSIRIGRTPRLLAVKQTINDQLVWVLLELLPDHDYDNARYLKPGAKDRFLEANSDRIQALAASGDDERVLEIADNTEDKAGAGLPMAGAGGPLAKIKPVELVTYNRQLIHMSERQDECLFSIAAGLTDDSFIALVAGAPGSGKTLLAKSIIEQLLEAGEDGDDAANVYYIAQSDKLRHEMAEQCGAAAADTVNYCAYQQMLQHAGVNLDDMMQVDDSHLLLFFTKVQDNARKLFRHKSKDLTDTGPDIEAILATMDFEHFRQECIVMSGINKPGDEGLAKYQAMGGSHSLFHGKAELQQQLWQVYQDYMSGLAEAHQYHLKLSRFDVAKIEGNPTLLVDEALDLTRVQLQTLMAMGAKVVFVGDHNQDLENISHSMEYLRGLITASGAAQTYVAKLNKTYRCATHIASIASKLLGVKKGITSHGSDLVDIEVNSALDATGSVAMIGAKPSEVEQVQRLCGSVDTAVICPQDKKAAVAAQLGATLVFSIAEIKGLGYKRIILRDLISSGTAVRLLKLLEGGKKKRADITAADKILITDLNNLFTAISRAETELVFMSSVRHPKIKELINVLADGIQFTAIDAMGIDAGPSTEAEWHAEALRQQGEGNHEQARQIAERFGFILSPDDGPRVDVKESETTKKSALPGVLESKISNPAADIAHAVGMPVATVAKPKVRKRKSKKKKATASVSVVTEISTAKAKASKAKQDGDLIIAFPIKLTKAQKKKKGNKRKLKRKIDFSSVLSVEDLEFLMTLPEKHINNIKAKHIHSLLMTHVDDDFPRKKKELYEKAINHVFKTCHHIYNDYHGIVFSHPPDFYAEGHRQTVAYRLIMDPVSTVEFYVCLLPLAIKFASSDERVLKPLAKRLGSKSVLGCSSASVTSAQSFMLYADPHYTVALLDLYMENPVALDVVGKTFNTVIPDFIGLDGRMLSVMSYMLTRSDGVVFSKLVKVARNISYIRNLMIAMFELTYVYEACFFQDSKQFPVAALGEFIALAEDDVVVMDFLVNVLQRKNTVNYLTILHDIANRNFPIFKQLVALAKTNDKMLAVVNNALLSSSNERVGVMTCHEAVLVPLIELALHKSEFTSDLANSLSGNKILYIDDGPREVCFVVRWIKNPSICKEEYPYVMRLAEKSSEFANAFITCLLEGQLGEYHGLILFATHYSKELVSFIELALKNATVFERLFTQLDVPNEAGVTPLDVVKRYDPEGYERIIDKLRELAKRHTAGTHRARLFGQPADESDAPASDTAGEKSEYIALARTP